MKSFLDEHCVKCHSPGNDSGKLDLEKLLAKNEPGDFAKWVKVHDRVKSGEMPPAKEPKPKKVDVDAALKAVAEQLTAVETALRVKNGRTTMRRLNRVEFENTLRDLLAVPGLNVKELLPEDGRADGYDRSASALDVSPVLMAKYGEAVDAALDLAIAKWSLPPQPPKEKYPATESHDLCNVVGNGDGVLVKDFKYDARFPLVVDEPYGGRFKNLGDALKGGAFKEPGTFGMFRHTDDAFQGRFSYAPIYPGKYRIGISCWSFWWDRGEIKPTGHTGAASLYAGGNLIGYYDAPSLKPTQHETTIWLDAGGFIKFNAASLWPIRISERKGHAAEYSGPAIAVDWISIEGPLEEQWPPESHRRLFGNLPLIPFEKMLFRDPKPARVVPKQLTPGARNQPVKLMAATVASTSPAADAERLLKDFLPRAFRRPVAADEVARLTARVLQRIAAGACFEDAMRNAYKAILISPEFLFLQEAPGPLDDYSLACRLSYFLWDSLPDDDLTSLAAAGRLHDGSELRKQVDRMLADPKAERFRADFLDQWLDLRDFDLTSPDRALYPEFNLHLHDAMQREPREYFKQLIAGNRQAVYLIKSDFAMINQRLAEHYGLPGVPGGAFRQVNLPAATHRGGFLTQAAILKVTANGTTTSPVKRGAWVMRKLLDRPPEPPPPDVPAIEPDVRGVTTIREILAKHRDNAACAACHAKIDPPGFALESFDVIGGFRERYRATQGGMLPEPDRVFLSHLDPDGHFPRKNYGVSFKFGPEVDPHGVMPTGAEFDSIDSFRKLLAKDERGLARNFTKQLILYSTGAPLGFSDRAALEQALDRAGNGFGIRSLIHEVIQSPLFLNK